MRKKKYWKGNIGSFTPVLVKTSLTINNGKAHLRFLSVHICQVISRIPKGE